MSVTIALVFLFWMLWAALFCLALCWAAARSIPPADRTERDRAGKLARTPRWHLAPTLSLTFMSSWLIPQSSEPPTVT